MAPPRKAVKNYLADFFREGGVGVEGVGTRFASMLQQNGKCAPQAPHSLVLVLP